MMVEKQTFFKRREIVEEVSFPTISNCISLLIGNLITARRLYLFFFNQCNTYAKTIDGGDRERNWAEIRNTQ